MQHHVRRDIGEEIRKARETKGLSQETVASMIGLTRQTIQNVEYGKNFSMKILLDICKALEIDSITIKIEEHETEINAG